MAEYYTALRKAVGRLEANRADARRTVYGEVRQALIEELKAAVPPLSTAEIAGRRLELEEAIRKVEREESRLSGGGPEAPVLDGRKAPNPAPAAKRSLSRRGLVGPSHSSAKARPSRRFSFVLTVPIIAIILGAGALAWSKRVMIGQIITKLDGGRAMVGAANPPGDDAASPAAPVAPGVAPTPAPAADAGTKLTPTHGTRNEASPAGPAAPLLPSASENANVSGGLFVQNAILHEESVNFTGITNINASVTWRYVDDGANGPAIEANLQVPERRMKIKLTIHKNTDNSLAASHLIDIKIDAPSDLPGKSIQKLTGILMKPTEEARGQPLSGAEAKITDGFFWIALSGADLDLPRNLALLRDGEWIDLPFTYETGQRAILTFEKGSQGDQVFQKAMAAWTTR